jgi:hypothetical protein
MVAADDRREAACDPARDLIDVNVIADAGS